MKRCIRNKIVASTIMTMVWMLLSFNIPIKNMVDYAKLSNQYSTFTVEAPPDDILIPDYGPDPKPFRNILDAIQPTKIKYTPNEILLDEMTGATCFPTSQIRVTGTTNESKWILHTYDQHGNPKSTGGDEFHIEFMHELQNIRDDIMPNTTHSLATAVVHDNGDGSYELDFVTSPLAMVQIEGMHENLRPLLHSNTSFVHIPGGGKLNIHFVYTCKIGNIAPPEKNSWNSGGCSQTSYSVRTDLSPPIRMFKKPEIVFDFAKFDKVLCFGDSLMNQLCGVDRKMDRYCTFRSNNVASKNVGRALTLDSWKYFASAAEELLRNVTNQVLAEHNDDALADNNTEIRIGLIMGSSTWDILEVETGQGREWKGHRTALKNLLTKMQTISKNTIAEVTIMWKSPTPLHSHVVVSKETQMFGSIEKMTKRVKYMSQKRSEALYKYQKQICKEIDIPFLDVYEAYQASGDWHFPTDGRHFRSELNQLVLNWFYSTEEDVLYDHSFEGYY